jgi:G patch domain-containing protein 1
MREVENVFMVHLRVALAQGTLMRSDHAIWLIVAFPSYFNTVGSKEGWAPSTFVSSRGNRKKDGLKTLQQRPEDFMDDEDLADAAEAQKVQTAEGYAGLGSTEGGVSRPRAILDIFKTEGETMGIKLLKRMGWREGQGVGPKVRRKARLDELGIPGEIVGETHLFAPENTRMISIVKKTDHKGLGYDREPPLASDKGVDTAVTSEDESQYFGTAVAVTSTRNKKSSRGGIGIGILNDTGSDDEDPYEIGPRISYNKVIGGDKRKKKPLINGSARPVFISKKKAMAKTSASLRKCHDGRLPLDGFVLSNDASSLSSIIASDGKYLPPKVPDGWKSAKQPSSDRKTLNYLSTAEAARESRLDPKARAMLLGEASLPGKSVFDYLSSAARERLASASGRTNLPPALGEIPKGYALTDEERQRELSTRIPKLERDVAIAALARGASGWMPYAEDENKRSRYREYLEGQAGIRESLPQRVLGITKDDWLKELQEFAHCAQIFKPMTGTMATRFTSSLSSKTVLDSQTSTGTETLLSKPAPKAEDPAEAAAKVGMFGPMTRSTQDFYPTRLLCKRFNVKPPAHVQLDPDRTAEDGGDGVAGGYQAGDGQPGRSLELVSKSAMNDIMIASGGRNQYLSSSGAGPGATDPQQPTEDIVDPDRNEALEGERAGEAVFKAIFGDDDDDD